MYISETGRLGAPDDVLPRAMLLFCLGFEQRKRGLRVQVITRDRLITNAIFVPTRWIFPES